MEITADISEIWKTVQHDLIFNVENAVENVVSFT